MTITATASPSHANIRILYIPCDNVNKFYWGHFLNSGYGNETFAFRRNKIGVKNIYISPYLLLFIYDVRVLQ